MKLNPLQGKTHRLFAIMVMANTTIFADGPTVSNVKARQRYPWNGLVDITCEVQGIDGTTNGFGFVVDAVMPDTGNARRASNLWVVQCGTNSTNREVHTNGNYRLLWDARADFGTVKYTNMVARVDIKEMHAGQLWEGGPCWAATNIGAKEPWEYGYYFWWGDIVGYKRENNAWVATDGSAPNFSFDSSNTPTYNKDIATLQSEGWIISRDGTYILTPEHDAAHVQLGGAWRMPTQQEFDDLNSKCDWIWTTMSGVNGYVVRGRGDYAANSIFLPCVGLGYGTSLYYSGSESRYWPSAPYSNGINAYELGFNSSGHFTSNHGRYYGCAVRPVQGADALTVAVIRASDSNPFLLDTTDGPRIARDTESIAWSGLWAADESAAVTVTVNGVPLFTNHGEGIYEWAPSRLGIYGFRHSTAGTAEILEAVFKVPTVSKGATTTLNAYICDFGDTALSVDDNVRSWDESFHLSAPDSDYAYDMIYDSHATPNNWIAENATFVSQTGTNQFGQNGMALRLSGGGMGTVAMNCDDSNLPHRPGEVSFDARLGQTLSFDDFAYSKNHMSDTNYAVSGECIFSPLYNGTDMSPASPSVSAAIFYSPGGGCYEYRARLIQRQETPFTAAASAKMEYTLYKWFRSGSVMTNAVLARRYGVLNSNYPYHHNNYSGDTQAAQRNRFTYWSGIFISAHYDKDAKETYICAGISNQKNNYGISWNYSRYFYGAGTPPQAIGNNGYLTVTDDGTIGGTPHSRGTFGFAFNDCPGYVGFINQHGLDSNHRIDAAKDINGVTIPTSTSVTTLLDQREIYNELHFDSPEDTTWAFPSGRMTVMRAADKLFTVSETYKWGYGVKAVIPTNSVDVYVKESGGEWAKAGEANVSSFQTNRVVIPVPTIAKTRVKIATSEGSGDVVVDNIEVSEWRAEDSGGLNADTCGLMDEWVYTQGWMVESPTESGVGCRLQPCRGVADKPMGVRSPFTYDGLSTVSFAYTSANSNAVVLVQIATNLVEEDFCASTISPSDQYWTTIQTNTFENVQPGAYGVCTCQLPSAEPLYGAVRLIVDPQTIVDSVSNSADYGAITITDIVLEPKTFHLRNIAVSVSDAVYTGEAVRPTIAMTNTTLGVALEEGIDYTISCNDNVNVGVATVAITGIGNYAGTLTRSFTVDKMENEWVREPSMAGWGYGDEPGEPDFGEAKYGSAEVTYGDSGTIRPSKGGEYVATFIVPETATCKELVKSVPFRIQSSLSMSAASNMVASRGHDKYASASFDVEAWSFDTSASEYLYPTSSVSWISAKPQYYQYPNNGGDGLRGRGLTVRYQCEENATTEARVGTIGGELLGIPYSFTVYQEGKKVVTFDANGGEGGWSRTMHKGDAMAAPQVARTGYVLLGWIPEVASTVPDDDVAYVAQWSPNRYTVRYNPNGGEGSMSSKLCVYDEEFSIGTNEFVREGYEFAGWFLGGSDSLVLFSEGETLSNLTENVEGEVTLFATWAPKKYRVEFVDGSGEADGAVYAEMPCDSLIAAPAMSRAGYELIGWSPAFTNVVQPCDALYVAQWRPLPPIVVPTGATTFLNASQSISLSHDSGTVTILYTTDGRDPVANGREYRGAFEVYESCTVRAVAYGSGRYSDEATATFTRNEPLSAAANLYGYLMETDAEKPWTVVTDVSHDGVSCVRSGAIGNGGTTWLQTSVKKAGRISFWWRAACEEADEEDGDAGYYDYGAFLVDDAVVARIAGHDTGWRKVEQDVPAGGKHVLRWEYRKDGSTTYSPDCVWLDQVQWVPAAGDGHTFTAPEQVPYSWLAGYGLGVASGDFEAAAKAPSGKRALDGKAMSVWEDFVAGTDPTNANSVFTATIEMVDGAPRVRWSPDLNSNGVVRTYTVFGKAELSDESWHSPTNAADRFFKVEVGMP